MFVDIEDIDCDGLRLTLVGTRIVTPEALDEIDAIMAELAPDVVVLDYDETRWRWLSVLSGESEVDLVQVIRSGQMAELNARLAMGVLQKSLAPRTGVSEDAEFVRAHAAAVAAGAQVVFGRRPVDIEGLRAWRRCTVGGRVGFALSLLKGSLRRTQLDPDSVDVDRFDMASSLAAGIDRAADAAPVLFDEAAVWLGDVVRGTSQERVVVFTRSSSFEALSAAIAASTPATGLDVVPDKTLFSRVVPWAFTGLIIAAFILGFVFADPEKMQQAMLAWFVSNMSFAALGALLALAHPVTIIATSMSAPFVSLNPAIGAGMVGALVQAFVAPPTVRDMDRVGDDITRLSGWWRNRLARLVLIFVFANVFSSIGSFAAFAWFPT